MDESKLLLDHQELIRRVVACNVKFFNGGNDFDDYVSEANIAAIKAIRSFKEDSGAKLSTYIVGCVRNRLIDLHKHYARQKYQAEEFPIDDYAQYFHYSPSRIVLTQKEKSLAIKAIDAGGKNNLIGRSPKNKRGEIRACFLQLHRKLK